MRVRERVCVCVQMHSCICVWPNASMHVCEKDFECVYAQECVYKHSFVCLLMQYHSSWKQNGGPGVDLYIGIST